MPRATSKTIVRMWTKEGYHKDVAILDSEQIRMRDMAIEPSGAGKLMDGPIGIRVVVDPKDFPEACEFEIIVAEYK